MSAIEMSDEQVKDYWDQKRRTDPTIPTSFVLGPHEYRIEAGPEAADRLQQNVRRGEALADQLLIRVDPEGPHTVIAETLLHEALHMCWSQAALNELEPAHEEHIIDALTPLILQLLRRNTDLTDYLLGIDAQNS